MNADEPELAPDMTWRDLIRRKGESQAKTFRPSHFSRIRLTEVDQVATDSPDRPLCGSRDPFCQASLE